MRPLRDRIGQSAAEGDKFSPFSPQPKEMSPARPPWVFATINFASATKIGGQSACLSTLFLQFPVPEMALVSMHSVIHS